MARPSNTQQIGAARKAELQDLFAKYGTLTPEQVLDYAKNRKTALHSHFTWDNTEAGELWRLHEARQLITRSFVVVEIPGSGEERKVRMSVSLPPDRGLNGYRLMTDVLADPDQRDLMLRTALRELAAFRRKYQTLNELSEVFRALEDVERQPAA